MSEACASEGLAGIEGSAGSRRGTLRTAKVSCSHIAVAADKTERGPHGPQDPYKGPSLSTYHDGRDLATSTSTPH
jgi:hypothetical protein